MAAENLMTKAHKANSDAYREGWEKTFVKVTPVEIKTGLSLLYPMIVCGDVGEQCKQMMKQES